MVSLVSTEFAFAEGFLRYGIRCSNPREGIDFKLEVKKASKVYAPIQNNAIFSAQLKNLIENPPPQSMYYSLGSIAERVSDVADLSVSIHPESTKGSRGVFDDYILTWTSIKQTTQQIGTSKIETNVSSAETAELHIELNKALTLSSSETERLENAITFNGKTYPLHCDISTPPGPIDPNTGELQ